MNVAPQIDEKSKSDSSPTTALGRSKDEEKGYQILLAAGALFMREGYAAVSMEQIAKEAGVSKQTVYSHFGSKETLFSAAVRRKCAEYEIYGLEPDYDRPVREYLREFIQHFSDLVTSEPGIAIHRLCISEADKHSKVAEVFWEAGPESIAAQLTNYLDKQVGRGALKIENTTFAADQLLFMVKSEAHLRGTMGLDMENALKQLPAYLDSCLDMFMRTYGG